MKSWYLLTILAVSIASLCACSKTDSAFEFKKPAIANEPLFSQDLQAVQNLELDDESRVLYESLENKCTQGNDDACEKLAHIYTSDYYMRTDKFSYGMNIYQDLCNKVQPTLAISSLMSLEIVATACTMRSLLSHLPTKHKVQLL